VQRAEQTKEKEVEQTLPALARATGLTFGAEAVVAAELVAAAVTVAKSALSVALAAEAVALMVAGVAPGLRCPLY
jgi:hypothetical protein